MRVQRRDGGLVHFGTRRKARGGYDVLCRRRKLVPFKDWKRTKKPINCPDCLEARAKVKKGREAKSDTEKSADTTGA